MESLGGELLYKGKPVADMTREELEEALEWAHIRLQAEMNDKANIVGMLEEWRTLKGTRSYSYDWLFYTAMAGIVIIGLLRSASH